MADMKISQLPAASSAADTQEFEINDSGTSRKITFQKIREKLKSVFDADYASKTHTHSNYAPAGHTHTVAQISDAFATGRNVLKAGDQAAARAAIGAGTSNLVLGTTEGTAKPGNWKPNINTDTTGQLPYSRLSGVPSNTPALPDHLGVGSYVNARIIHPGLSGSTSVPSGATIGGSSLGYVAFTAYGSDPTIGVNVGGTLWGTWKNMGHITASSLYGTCPLFMRIA